MRIPRPQLNYANVIATIALFVALGGAAVAAGLPRNSVGTSQLKRGAVSAAKLKRGAVTAGKIAPKAVVAGKLGANAVLPGNLGNGIITTNKLSDSSVIAAKIKNGAVTTNKLNNGTVTSAKIGDGAVNPNKLGDGAVTFAKLAAGVPGQLQTNPASGVTIRGTFDLGSVAATAGDTTRSAISLPYAFPLHHGPAVQVVGPGEAPGGNCPGIGAEDEVPTANPGELCVYITKAVNLGGPVLLEPENLTRFGTGLIAQAKDPGPFYAYGVWAVTAR
jgi:hypothetical protein